MGVYNSVYFRCPSCNSPLEVQSKVLDGHVSHSCDEVPRELAQAIDGKGIYCSECNRPWMIIIIPPMNTVRMRLVDP